MTIASRTCLVIAWLPVLVAGCTPSDDQVVAPPLVVVVSGDTAGWIVPCGCTSSQAGGLLRRGSYLADLRTAEEVVYVDVGGAAAGTSPYERGKFEAIVRGELALGVSAHNIGAAEARLGADYLQTVQHTLHVPFLTCNVRTADGELLGQALQIIRTARGCLGIVGVLSDTTSFDGLRVDPPRDAILQVLAAAKPRPDFLLVLAYLPGGELEALARDLPEADLIVGGPTGQSIAPCQVGPTVLASATSKGKYLAEFKLTSADAPRRWQGAIVELTDRFADDQRQVQNLHEFYASLRAHDFTPHDTSFVTQLSLPESFRIAGTETCRDCHADECRVWDGSGHAQAWQVLIKTGAEVDPYCQQCHVTGYGVPNGFVSVRRSADRVAVGCESCHGAASAHAHDPAVRTTFFGRARDQCVSCHDHENSPKYDYEKYWPQILHGPQTSTPAPAAVPAVSGTERAVRSPHAAGERP